MNRQNEATRDQIRAADPGASTWLSANAGSGKTRVLTDRVALLLLNDVPPQNILCLTYTKAAASEMQNRLFKRLGAWAMLPDDALRTALGDLGVATAPDGETLARARRLFARAIETPGGLKIQTIHSFCAGLLRRFPIEAGVSPGFSELDETATRQLQMAVLDDIARREPAIFSEMAALVSDADMTGLAAALSRHRKDFGAGPDRAATLAAVGLPADFSPDTAFEALGSALNADPIAQIIRILADQSPTMQEFAAELAGIRTSGLGADGFAALRKRCLYASGDQTHQPKPSALTKKAREGLGPLADDFDALAVQVADVQQALMAHEVARTTEVLHRFAAVFLPEYARRKQMGGWLDFDDQIQMAEALLAREGVAEWVLYKLDGAIDHILVDEAQDTSPLQWEVITHLTREFTSGTGSAEAGERSIFVVGDLKQSIYSFQGADPTGFTNMRRAFAEKLSHIGLTLQELELKYSFRSSGEILNTVDLSFGTETPRGMGDAVRHLAFKSEMPGRVDLWPLIEPTPKRPPEHWYDPVDLRSDDHHVVRLARRVADQARDMVESGFLWEEHDGAFRPRQIHEGDILVLVQGRGAGSNVSLFQEIIRACKERGLEVAGADVLKLGEELAVRDILSVLAFLSTPEDDLALAEALRSPLFGWSEAQLFDLATQRGEHEYLWAALRRRQAEFTETFAILRDMRNGADFRRPYDLIERLLTRHDGRRRLVARLGAEASDGIDALLAQALAFEQDRVPSLTGFLARMEGADVDVKRRAEGQGRKIRVMTVHGAKGLESPIVILPDCGARKQPREFRDSLLPTGGAPLWNTARAESPEAVNRLRQAAIDKQLEESQRLLYVAMTRAEQWLIVAAAGDLGRAGDSWYEQVRAGMTAGGAAECDFFGGEPGLRLQSPKWDGATRPHTPRETDTTRPPLPEWAQVAADTLPRPESTLSPSDLGGEKALPGEGAGLSEAAAKARGTRVHRLLETLPGRPKVQWPDIAQALADAEATDADTAEALAEARRALDSPALAFVFAGDTLAEVDIAASLPALDGARIHGSIDRLVLRPESVLAVDFKTNAAVPDDPDTVPDGLLRQMGAYAAALKQVFPDRKVETAILWTRTAQLMYLPDDMVSAALVTAGAP